MHYNHIPTGTVASSIQVEVVNLEHLILLLKKDVIPKKCQGLTLKSDPYNESAPVGRGCSNMVYILVYILVYISEVEE